MTLFSTFAMPYLANKLGVSIDEAANLYATVQKTFHINISSNKYAEPEKDETFSAYLTYTESAVTTNLILFEAENRQTKFATPEEAFEVAITQINNIEFIGKRNFFPEIFPPNVLILFDTQMERIKFEQTQQKNKFSTMSKFSTSIKQHYANKLKFSVQEIDELYNFVQKYFFISINSFPPVLSKEPKKFYSRLWFKDDDDAYIITEFDRKTPHQSPYPALESALRQVTNISLHVTAANSYPSNLLILFDINRERERIMNKSWHFKH